MNKFKKNYRKMPSVKIPDFSHIDPRKAFKKKVPVQGLIMFREEPVVQEILEEITTELETTIPPPKLVFTDYAVRKVESRKLTPKGNWIPVVTNLKGMLDILNNNIKLMNDKPWKAEETSK